jgi:spore maturation protein CgeB
MKFLRLLKLNYPGALKVLEQLPAELTYTELLEACNRNGVLYGTGLTESLQTQGFDAQEIFADSIVLQRAWARDNGVEVNWQGDWQTQTVLAQIEKLRPDILYFQDTHALPHEVRRGLRDKFSFLKKVVIFKGFPHDLDQIADADIVLSGIPSILTQCRSMGMNAHLMYHAFDTGLLSPVPPTSKHPFVFAGSSGLGYRFHNERYWHLLEMLESTDIECWLDEAPAGHHQPGSGSRKLTRLLVEKLTSASDKLSDKQLETVANSKFVRGRFRGLAQRLYHERQNDAHFRAEIGIKQKSVSPGRTRIQELFPDRCQQPLFGKELIGLFSSSEVVFNKHTEAADGLVGNMRMFEVTGAGACLLTDNGKNIRDLFEPDSEVVVYNSIEESIEKAKYLRNHPTKAREIAAAGHRRTLRDHTYAKRAEFIGGLLRGQI